MRLRIQFNHSHGCISRSLENSMTTGFEFGITIYWNEDKIGFSEKLKTIKW